MAIRRSAPTAIRRSAPSPAKGARSPHAWTEAPARTPLGEGQVHVWRADLRTVSDDLTGLLSSEECVRARRFPHAHSGQLWKRAHGVLRALLGGYLEIDPTMLRFAATEYGKPTLVADAPGARRALGSMGRPHTRQPNAASLSFNLSHSGALALYAFARERAVGVDVEVAKRPIDELAIAARVFGPERAQCLERLEPVIRKREFLRAWVRHEAALKCVGAGIGGEAGSGREDVWVAELDLGWQAAAAVALERPPEELCRWEWPPADHCRSRHGAV
jgi:4'-phosphopantetheinyl transferase